ncbi:PAS domain S-box-containing protein/diguanylate cyclase (GGDEF) domain-containing protein [Arsukibacterium tuosuense]|uniref:Sensor protein FixL n=1 Tax=Arsukibacterium tuosuense TaxID=1323745 RepID=A0A285JJE4_9GAMM|nr:EAL domain-containing protein [Arsukibacterium tuosuense]SNY60422.1 PAS domain S-box-containing protein/diguanylate cyclase (GGDEF) domain-containing protein [Arsukibacterium tuosuense]
METFQLSQLQDAIVHSAVDAIIVIDQQGLICFFSPSAEKLFGYSAAECVGQNVRLLMPEPFHGEHDSYLKNYIKDKKPAKIIGIGRDVQGKRKDGSIFPMHLSVGESKTNGKRYFVGICHDLTAYQASVKAHLKVLSVQDALLEAAVDGIISIDEFGIVQSFNRGAEQLFGYKKQEVIGQNVSMLMTQQHAGQHDSFIDNYKVSGKAKIIGIGRDVQAQHKDGSVFPMHLSVGESITEQGRIFVGVCHDLSEFKAVLQRLISAEQRYRDIVQNQKEFICRLSKNSRLTFVNNAFSRQLNQQLYQMLGISIFEFIHADERHSVEALLTQLRQGGEAQTISLSVRMLGADNAIHWVDWTFSSLAGKADSTDEIQGVGIDITEQVKAKNHAKFLTSFDSLTGLLNKEGLMEQFGRRSDADAVYAVLFIDCHRFRLINEKYGYEFGDLMLIEAAHRLQSLLPGGALVCRPGADDFIVLLPLAERSELLPFVYQLIEQCTEPYWLAQEKIAPSICIGISMFPDDSSQFTELIQQAESAMFDAKHQGLPLRLYHEDIHSALTRRLELEQGLRRALEHNLLTVVLQPKYRLLTEQLIGYEALVRWHDAALGTVAPDVFVAVAEAVNLGKKLDCWVINAVLQQLSEWQQAGLTPQAVAVNITSKHFSDPALYQFIMDKLQQLQLAPDCLQLEITEGVAMDKSPTTLANLNAFRRAGIKIAIDDFGTGYSSLSYLTSLPIDFIKIDKTFVQALDNGHNLSLVKAMLAMASAIEVEVIAEGIETPSQQQLLATLGCQFGQGYLYAKPTALADIEQQLIAAG